MKFEIAARIVLIRLTQSVGNHRQAARCQHLHYERRAGSRQAGDHDETLLGGRHLRRTFFDNVRRRTRGDRFYEGRKPCPRAFGVAVHLASETPVLPCRFIIAQVLFEQRGEPLVRFGEVRV